MLTLTTLASGSSGNCYLLSCDDETLILDCGIPIKEIKKGLDYNVSNVNAVLVTHGHQDHARSLSEFQRMGIDCFTPYLETNKSQARKFGGFKVQSFEVPHDNVACCGFYIVCPDGQRMVYATDFSYIPVSFKKLKINTLLIECNYCKSIVDRDKENYSHVARGHAELQTTIGIVKDNVSNALRSVIVCHLSSSNADSEEILTEVKKVAGNANVYVAERGLTVDLSEVPF
jgi:phosphoribosyl 1,2-cyclic phosphodiesterase